MRTQPERERRAALAKQAEPYLTEVLADFETKTLEKIISCAPEQREEEIAYVRAIRGLRQRIKNDMKSPDLHKD